ncbi:MAG: hypothetical protein KGY38_02795 [Desulfobacterales bacterium]|nr:hypothetical protein [Desulfobacterales bacterium]
MDKVEATFRRLQEGLYNEPGAEIIEDTLINIAVSPAVKNYVPSVAGMAEHLRNARQTGDHSVRENLLIALYHRLHAAGAVYKSHEEETLKAWKGLGCVPGGLMPLFIAGHFIKPESVTADLGAGNGLQGLLMQALCPHRQTLLVEISENLIETGRLYQQALGIAGERILWEHGDIADTDLREVDLVYMYRPIRPLEDGILLYKNVAEKLAENNRSVTVVSMADCMGRFLDKSFKNIYSNEFVEIYRLQGGRQYL